MLTPCCTTRQTFCTSSKPAGNGKFKAVGESLEAQEYGIAFPKGSDDLRTKVNGALKTLRDNGTYNEIYKKVVRN